MYCSSTILYTTTTLTYQLLYKINDLAEAETQGHKHRRNFHVYYCTPEHIHHCLHIHLCLHNLFHHSLRCTLLNNHTLDPEVWDNKCLCKVIVYHMMFLLINSTKTNFNKNNQMSKNLHQISPLFSGTHAKLHYSTATGGTFFYQTSDKFSWCYVDVYGDEWIKVLRQSRKVSW